jgi:glycosyltransferase involved in cell wall biosynthesis
LYAVDKVFMTDHISRPVGWQPRRASLWKRAIGHILSTPITKVFCVSSFVYGCWKERGMFDPARLAVVYNGVDVARADIGLAARDDFRRRHSIPGDRIVVLQAGWLIPEKGADNLLGAAKRVVVKNDRVHFVLAGEGPQRHDLEQLAHDSGIASNVTFTGRIEDPLGEGLYAASDLVCQVSRWEEAFGLTIAEAMASKRPVIATRVGAIPELVDDGQSGCLVDRDDQAGLADRILLLAEDTKLREAMGKAGSEICRTKFDLTTNVTSLIRHYGC